MTNTNEEYDEVKLTHPSQLVTIQQSGSISKSEDPNPFFYEKISYEPINIRDMETASAPIRSFKLIPIINSPNIAAKSKKLPRSNTRNSLLQQLSGFHNASEELMKNRTARSEKNNTNHCTISIQSTRTKLSFNSALQNVKKGDQLECASKKNSSVLMKRPLENRPSFNQPPEPLIDSHSPKYVTCSLCNQKEGRKCCLVF